MLNLERILNPDSLVWAMTGLHRPAFESLLPSFTAAYHQILNHPEVQRTRAPGGGGKATLKTIPDKLLYILLYCKCYPTFDLMGVLFDFDRSCAHDWVHRLLPILEQALGHKQPLPECKVRSIEEFLERFPDGGMQNEFANIRLPHKKPRGQKLSEQQKQENREFSRQRVKCEHAHVGIKRHNAVSAVYRNRVPGFDDRLMSNAAGLWNFY